jgi:hypothetical protein
MILKLLCFQNTVYTPFFFDQDFDHFPLSSLKSFGKMKLAAFVPLTLPASFLPILLPTFSPDVDAD